MVKLIAQNHIANLQVISQDIEQFVSLYDRDDKELQEKYCQGYYALDYIYNINNYN